MKYLRRGSGYYIDVGAAELVADGQVKLASGQVDHLTEDAVVLDDGTELPADLVVYATGYGSMNGWAAELISQEVADRVGKVWGLGSDTTKDPGPWEGEQRNMWKPTQQPGALVSRRQPAPVAPLLALPRAAAQGARGRDRDAGVRAAGGPPHGLSDAGTPDDARSLDRPGGSATATPLSRPARSASAGAEAATWTRRWSLSATSGHQQAPERSGRASGLP